jgi:hypothetical protein
MGNFVAFADPLGLNLKRMLRPRTVFAGYILQVNDLEPEGPT